LAHFWPEFGPFLAHGLFEMLEMTIGCFSAIGPSAVGTGPRKRI
jgi:hypothetical protein